MSVQLLAASVLVDPDVNSAIKRPATRALTANWLRLTFRALLACGLLWGVWGGTRQAIASWYFDRNTVLGIRTAMRWDPGNPRYPAELARMLEVSEERSGTDEIIALYERATRLGPNRAPYWVELGSAYEWASRLEDSKHAYQRAHELFPNSAEVNWQLGGFFIRTGNSHAALGALNEALRHEPALMRPTFELAWRAEIPPDEILDEIIPARAGYVFSYLSFLLETNRIAEADRAWERILVARIPFEPEAAFPYLDALHRLRRVSDLTAAWAAMAERSPARIHLPHGPADLIPNGSFEDELLNGGLDWRITSVEGAAVELDSTTYFDGSRSLAIHFDGSRNLDYAQVSVDVPVAAAHGYRFIGYMRTERITTDSGPRFEILDSYDPAQLSVSTTNRLGTSDWVPEQIKFRTGPSTQLLVVRISRLPSHKLDNRIGGTVWVDKLSLQRLD